MGNLFTQEEKPVYWKDLQPGDVQQLAGTIVSSYKDVLIGPKGDALKFSDLTSEQKQQLIGPPGKDGKDGKDGINGKDGALSCSNNQCYLPSGNLYLGNIEDGIKNRKLNVIGNNISVVNPASDRTAGIEFLVGKPETAYYDFYLSADKSMTLRNRSPGLGGDRIAMVVSQNTDNKNTVSFPDGRIRIGEFQIWQEGDRLYIGKGNDKAVSIGSNSFPGDRFQVYRDAGGGANYFYVNHELQFGRNNYKPQQW